MMRTQLLSRREIFYTFKLGKPGLPSSPTVVLLTTQLFFFKNKNLPAQDEKSCYIFVTNIFHHLKPP